MGAAPHRPCRPARQAASGPRGGRRLPTGTPARTPAGRTRIHYRAHPHAHTASPGSLTPARYSPEVNRLVDRVAVLFVALAAALWASDAYFRPALTHQLSASQIVLVEDALITLCFLPAIPRIRREVARLSVRDWLALGAVALGPQAFATVLFTRSLR